MNQQLTLKASLPHSLLLADSHLPIKAEDILILRETPEVGNHNAYPPVPLPSAEYLCFFFLIPSNKLTMVTTPWDHYWQAEALMTINPAMGFLSHCHEYLLPCFSIDFFHSCTHLLSAGFIGWTHETETQ